MNFTGKALDLTPDDVDIVAGYLGIEIAALRAVMAIEAAGRGFDKSRRPTMLFEPHVFWRELGSGAKRDRAAREGLAYAKWGAQKYPRESYTRLSKAVEIDREKALRSASWGLGQVMGFNHKAAGFDSASEMVEAMMHSEGAQLFAMARFMVTNGLHRHLRDKNWAAFARGYNGPGFRKNKYDEKLAAAYSKRPAFERVVPPPAKTDQIDALLGKADAPKTPQKPADAQKPAPVAPTPAKPEPAPEPAPRPAPAAKSWLSVLIEALARMFKR